MAKSINIKCVVDDEHGKVGTAIETEGYSNDSISDQLELLGITENIKSIIHDRIKVLARKRE